MARPRVSRSLSWLAAAIAVLAIGGVAAWVVVTLPRRARELAIVGARAVFHQEVSIAKVHGDPWRGVVFEDVAAGRPAADAAAALVAARRVTIYFDPIALIRGLWSRRGAGESISQIVLDEPVVAAARDRGGVWNLTALFPPAGGAGAEAPFRGRLIVIGGRITFVDRHRTPAAFQSTLEDINGTVDFARHPRAAIRVSFVEARNGRRVAGRLSGAYVLSAGTIDLDVEASGIDAGAWGPYFVTTPAFRILGGEADIRMHVLRTTTAARATTDYSGRIRLRNGRASVPDRGGALADVGGDVIIANHTLNSAGLRGLVNGSPVEVRGEVSLYGEPRLDVAVRTNRADLATIRRLFFPGSRLRVEGTASGDIRIVGPLSSPRMVGRIEDARGHVEQQPFDHAAMEFAFYGQTLQVIGARGETAGGRVSGDAWWGVGTSEFLLAARLEDVDTASLRRWSPAAARDVSGRLDALVVASRHDDRLAVAGSASVTRPIIRGIAFDAVDAAFRADRGAVTLDRVHARQGVTWALATGRISPGGALALSAQGGAIDLARLPEIGSRLDLAGRSDFSGRIVGSWSAPELIGTLQVSSGRAVGVAFDAARGTVALRRGRLAIGALVARAGRARYRAAGSVEWGVQTRLGFDIEAERGSAATFTHLGRLPFSMSGQVDGRMRVEGPAARPSVTGTMSLRDAAIYGQRVDEATASFQWDGTRLNINQALVRRGESRLEVTGTVDRRTGFGLDIAARGLALRDLALPPLGATVDGRLDIRGRITGQPAAPVVALSANSANLLVNGIQFDRTEGRVRWEARTLTLDPLQLRRGNEQYQISGQIALNGSPSLDLSADVTAGRLSTLLGLANVRLGIPLDGTIVGRATVEGPALNPAANLDLRMTEGRFGDHPLVEGRADLTLRDGSVTIGELQLRPRRGLIAAQGRLSLRGESQVEVDGNDLDFDILRPMLGLRRPLLGTLNFTTQLGGTVAAPEIGFALDLRQAGVEGATFDSLVANAFYRDGLLQVQQALLTQNGHRLRASGVLPFNPALMRFDAQRPVDFRLTLADVNLSLLRLATPWVQEAAGAVEGEVQITGSVNALHVAGGVRVRDGQIRLRGLAVPLDTVRLDLRFDENAIRIAEGTARLGSGLARLQGTARIVQIAGPALALVVSEEAPLVLQGADLHVVVPPHVDARAGGTVRLWGTLGDPRRPPTIDGRVTFADGIVTVGPVGQGEPSQVPLMFRGVRLDVGRNLTVQVGGLRFALQPEDALALTGSLRSPMLDGTLAAEEGKVRALGAIFDLRDGTATFLPHQGLRPSVLAHADTQVGSTLIFLTVRGIAPDALTLDLRSEPDKPRAEIVALLGQQTGITRLLAGDIEGALRTEISRALFGAIERFLGLNELSIAYELEEPLALRAGKRLLRDLYLTLETTFTERPRWWAGLEYRFARDWQLTLRLDSDRRGQAVFWYTTRF